MFINASSFDKKDIDDSKKSILASQREAAGIIDARRSIYIFYDEKNPLECKVIQINISTTIGTKILFDKTFMNRHNGTLSFIAVYTYDCKLNTAYKTLKEQFLNGILTLVSVKRSDRETDHDNQYTRNEFIQLYSSLLPHYRLSSNIDARVVIHPRFYTQEHEYYVTNECNFDGILDIVCSLHLTGKDIVDDITAIYRQDVAMFKTIQDKLTTSRMFETINYGNDARTEASDVIRELNYTLTYDTLVNGGVFIYDTRENRSAFKDSSILCQKYINKAAAVDELQSFLLTLENIGTNIKNRDGDVTILYTPSLLGSKCRVIYRDYNNQVSDCGLQESISTKDSSFEVTETIGEFLDDDNSVFVHNEVCEDIRFDDMQKERLMSYFD